MASVKDASAIVMVRFFLIFVYIGLLVKKWIQNNEIISKQYQKLCSIDKWSKSVIKRPILQFIIPYLAGLTYNQPICIRFYQFYCSVFLFLPLHSSKKTISAGYWVPLQPILWQVVKQVRSSQIRQPLLLLPSLKKPNSKLYPEQRIICSRLV